MSVKSFSLNCPLPLNTSAVVLLAHGGGGRLMHQFLEQYVIPAFQNDQLATRHDGAVFDVKNARLAFTTDSYVVSPLFFPGADIGSLAVSGTVNDLAMCGARPLFLSAAFIMEEGLPFETLERVIASMRATAEAAGVHIVTGDTKVVDRGKCDKLFINTAGVGVIEHTQTIGPSAVRSGDAILLSGDVGRHGVAVMATREGLEFATAIESDCAPLAEPVLALLEAGIEVHCFRDLTRGGLATTLVEIAESSKLGIHIAERSVPVEEGVRGACEILGLDPLYLANEGRFVGFVAERDAENALDIMRKHAVSAQAKRIGTVAEAPASLVTLENLLGTKRILDMERGEPLPRIC
ncbi:Hydrogenase expression/formation protein HypE [Candidatus Koribacter versatilis Ellin345]|uniref:Hydrogenase expression/formation protein HypE n=1 Tax=Koribacter versatilis (strain Ellin345) TaxID=204669 RepID=Q1IQZ5_KORVE|nr:hydrogenase expression/formation protein HypE [Candidatus Koribacter versatilis]ABF40705.1 Hydrogenase expression/formation protein HypE [Candidatus Koribacter versatilis Ellin345]